MAKYEEILAYFQNGIPGGREALQTPQGGEIFNRWISDIMADLGVATWDEVPLAELDNYEYTGPVTAQAQPAEQALFDQIAPGLMNQVAGDAARAAEVDELTGQTDQAFGSLRDTLGMTTIRTGADGKPTSNLLDAQRANVDATVGTIVDAATVAAAAQTGALNTLTGEQLANLDQSLATQRTALEQQLRELQGNASAAAASRRAAIEEQMAALTAAQRPVAEARIRAAENEVTGINLGLQSTQDDLRAEAAREGFYGGSTMQESALARAAIDARQNAARSLGDARLANAVDDRSIVDYGAGQRYSIADALAAETQRIGDFGATGRGQLTAFGAETGRGIRDTGAEGRFNITSNLAEEQKAATTQGATAKAGYFDALYPGAVNSATALTQLPAQEAAAKASLLPYATAGTNNALNTFNWWAGNATPPNPTATLVQPDTSGNAIANLGAGVFGAAANWWKPPAQTPVKTPGAAKTGPTYGSSVWPSWTSYTGGRN